MVKLGGKGGNKAVEGVCCASNSRWALVGLLGVCRLIFMESMG